MMAQNEGRPLPKFGEWDVNNPATAEGYTVIFNKARVEKKTIPQKTDVPTKPKQKNEGRLKTESSYQYRSKRRRWFCCG